RRGPLVPDRPGRALSPDRLVAARPDRRRVGRRLRRSLRLRAILAAGPDLHLGDHPGPGAGPGDLPRRALALERDHGRERRGRPLRAPGWVRWRLGVPELARTVDPPAPAGSGRALDDRRRDRPDEDGG